MPRADTDVPRVLGRAGDSLVGASWAANAAVARVGWRAELRTAEVLDRLASLPLGPTVLNDLAIPIPNISANIDHVVVSGLRVLSWIRRAGGRRGTGRCAAWRFRGGRRFGHARWTTPRMAVDGLTRYLKRRGVQTRLVTPVVAVWPSSDRGRLSVSLLRMDGCGVVHGERLERAVRRAVGLRPADPDVVNALRRLLNAPRGRPRSSVLSAPRHR